MVETGKQICFIRRDRQDGALVYRRSARVPGIDDLHCFACDVHSSGEKTADDLIVLATSSMILKRQLKSCLFFLNSSLTRGLIPCFIIVALLIGCSKQKEKIPPLMSEDKGSGKIAVYQVMTRLFGNKNATNKPYGKRDENGVGKFN